MSGSSCALDPAQPSIRRGKRAKGSRSIVRLAARLRGHPRARHRDRHHSAQRQRAARPDRQDATQDRREALGVEVDRLRERQRVRRQPLERHRHGEEDGDAGEEDHPALEEVQEPLRLLDAVGVHENADHADAERVHEHGQGCCRQEQHRLVPHRAAVEDREEVGEGQDRKEVAQPRAGLRDLELVDPEVDDVAFEEHRDARLLHEPDAELRRHALEEDRQLPVEELRQRQHEDEMQHGELVRDPTPPAEDGQHHAADPHDHRVGHDVGDARDVAEERDQEGHADHRDTRPAVGDDRCRRWAAAQLAQEQVERDQRNQRSVGVLGRHPGAAERFDPDPEYRHRARHQKREPQQPRRIQGGDPDAGASCRSLLGRSHDRSPRAHGRAAREGGPARSLCRLGT